jgi:hypothetical protein
MTEETEREGNVVSNTTKVYFICIEKCPNETYYFYKINIYSQKNTVEQST